jgi:hypothetical protein
MGAERSDQIIQPIELNQPEKGGVYAIGKVV